jgi:hypothetical protein
VIVADLGLMVSMGMLVGLDNLIWGKGTVSYPYPEGFFFAYI